jgi:NADPH:quinone reductase-like Zn-dependent oxidoreductase
MRAAYITSFSKTLEKLRVESVRSVTRGEAKIKIMAASVNPSDVKNVQGKMEDKILSRIPGGILLASLVDGPPHLLSSKVNSRDGPC